MPEPQLPPESHYNPKKLDKIFAISALVLLASLVLVFGKDYSRQWKEYQRQFRALEVEKTNVKLDAAEKELLKNEEYQALLTSIEEAQKELAGHQASIKALKKQLVPLEAVLKLDTKRAQDNKADFDALKYRYESLSSHGGSHQTQALKIKLDQLASKNDEYRVKLEEDQRAIHAKEEAIKLIEKKYRDLDKKKITLSQKQEILTRKIKRIDQEKMSVANQVAEAVRDLPLIDLANPNYKIKQIVLKDIPEDVNFMKVQRVDRCTTCHQGIDNPDFKNAAQPFRTHPNLELFMDKNSPHPVEDFGCTSCHQGRGRGTDFVSAGHTPRNKEQELIWKKKYNWEPLHHWEQPMFSAKHTQAGCFKCHEDQGVIKGAERLNLGLALVERAGCYGCHTIKQYQHWPKSGPNLEYLASKTTKNWAYQWIIDPKSMRHNTWMPSYFNQSNNSDPASVKRSEQEVLSMVAFLFSNSKSYKPAAIESTGDALKGKELVASLGCMACHQVDNDKKNRDRNQLRKEFGPSLVGLGSKTDVEWLKDWLKDPSRYHPNTKMPNMRLSDKESADIAAYLSQDKSAAASKPIPSVNETVLNTIVIDFLKKSNTMQQAKEQLAGMSQDDKQVYAGKLLIREYGCYACHNIPGFENEKPIGVELTEEGSKNIHRLDFGFIHIDHTKEAWFKQKVMDPRIFDKGRVLQPLERIKMPNFNLNSDEADAVTTALLAFVKDRPNPNKMAGRKTGDEFINEGRALIRQLNCQSCHTIEGDGASIQAEVTDWLINYQGKDKAEAINMTAAFSPPNLLGEGAKVQAQWLFEFLHAPETIRPWISVRMPSYNYKAGEANKLVKYFNYLDKQEFPFTDIYHPNLSKEEFAAAETLFSKEVFGCALCHVVGDKMPTGTQDSWAPNLALASRLKPDWIARWIANPPALLPGTKMPVFFDPSNFENAGPPDVLDGDEHRQIKALRDYLLTLSNTSPDKVDAPQAVKPAE